MEDELHDVIDLEPKRKAKLARALSQLVVYTKSVRFRGFCDNQTDIKWWEMSSLCENEAQKCCIERRAHRFVHHNRRQLSRIYPAGYRIDSSNFNPQDMWNCGCQIGHNIALRSVVYPDVVLLCSGAELPEGGQDDAAEQGPVSCEWQLWVCTETRTYERRYVLLFMTVVCRCVTSTYYTSCRTAFVQPLLERMRAQRGSNSTLC